MRKVAKALQNVGKTADGAAAKKTKSLARLAQEKRSVTTKAASRSRAEQGADSLKSLGTKADAPARGGAASRPEIVKPTHPDMKSTTRTPPVENRIAPQEGARHSDAGLEKGKHQIEKAKEPSKKVRSYMDRRFTESRKATAQAIDDLKGNVSSNDMEVFADTFKFKDNQRQAFMSLAGKEKSDILGFVDSQKSAFVESPGFLDKVHAHKGVQKGAGVVGGAWLVNNMSARRGQQSNGELYGQGTPYM